MATVQWFVMPGAGALPILNPGTQISKAGAQFMQPGAQYWSQGRNTGAPQGQDFLTMIAPGKRSAK